MEALNYLFVENCYLVVVYAKSVLAIQLIHISNNTEQLSLTLQNATENNMCNKQSYTLHLDS